MNVQSANIDPVALRGYDPAEDAPHTRPADAIRGDCERIAEKLASAKRPIIYAGAGVRLAGVRRAAGLGSGA